MLAGQTLFFSAATKERGYELWKSDGAAAGTAELKDIRVGSVGATPLKLTAAGSRLYFWANQGTGYDLWKSDGTAGGTVLVKATPIITPAGQSPVGPVQALAVGSSVIFNQGGENWWSDGSTAGTVSLNVQSNGGLPTLPNYAILGPEVFFPGRRAGGFLGLWKFNTALGAAAEVVPKITPETLITLGSGIV